jgi:3-dehydroquinate dehydratase / shikimate dehydrogenase
MRMTYLCVSIFVRDAGQISRDIGLAAEAGADMVELRIDLRDDEFTIDVVRQLVGDCRLPCIVTCRPSWEGGNSTLPDTVRLTSLKAAVNAGAAYIDVELETYRRSRDIVPVKGRLILSTHDFAGRPDRLYNVIEELNATTGDVNKIVWRARSIRDNVEAFEILQQRQKPTIALCMGEAGIISRILAKKFGGFLTFASIDKDSVTAPGQVSIHDMKRLYRWDAIGPTTKVYGVVASPVMHSMSPAIHNAAFDETQHDGVYLPLLVNPGYESFKAFMESFLSFAPLHLSGLSITLPHKENALRYLKERSAEVEPLAEQIGAVNTILMVERASTSGSGQMATHLRGINTDYPAILDCITDNLGITRQQLADYRVAVIGAGGTGRTAVAALAHYGATVVVYNRTRQRADELAAEFNGRKGKVVAAAMEKLCDSCCHIYINTTSLGMYPNVHESPLGDRPPKFSAETLVFDSIYNPMKTKLLQQAEAAGAKTIGGVEMFVRQAAAQFQAWTNLPPPIDLMRRTIEQKLSQHR